MVSVIIGRVVLFRCLFSYQIWLVLISRFMLLHWSETLIDSSAPNWPGSCLNKEVDAIILLPARNCNCARRFAQLEVVRLCPPLFYVLVFDPFLANITDHIQCFSLLPANQGRAPGLSLTTFNVRFNLR